MNMVTSADMIAAVHMCETDIEVNNWLNDRDNDKHLDCAGIRADVTSPPDSDKKVIKVIFKYTFIDGRNSSGVDVIVEISELNGDWRIDRKYTT